MEETEDLNRLIQDLNAGARREATGDTGRLERWLARRGRAPTGRSRPAGSGAFASTFTASAAGPRRRCARFPPNRRAWRP